jgi:hypothetical protein
MNIRTIFCWLLLASASGWGQTQLQPFNSFWFSDTNQISSDRMSLLTSTLPAWLNARVFDGFVYRVLPPTFEDPQPVITLINSLNGTLNGKVIAATLSVGTVGWESSNNSNFANKQQGCTYDATKAESEQQWLQSIGTLQENAWAWIDGNTASMPTPAEAATSASTFVNTVKAQGNKAVIWLSAQAIGPQLPMLQAICAATKDSADYFGWMDIPSVIALNALGHNPTSAQEGEMSPAMLAQLSQTLDAILALTPLEKTYIQWINGPNSPTEDVAGTTAYIAGCQAKGINNFVLLANVNELQQSPWQGFYMSLAKRPRGRRSRRP